MALRRETGRLWSWKVAGGSLFEITHNPIFYGAAPLGSNLYAIPASNKVFADAVNGNDTWSGANPTNSPAGTGPKKTLNAAITSVGAAGTVVLRAGTYRERWDNTKGNFTIQNYPNELVLLSGADVITGWVVDGTIWRKDGYNPPLTRTVIGASNSGTATNVNLASYPDQVFFNDVPHTQVANKTDVVAGTFYVDTALQQLFVGSNPLATGVVVEASMRQDVLNLKGSSTKIQGIGVIKAGNHSSNQGAVKLNATNCTAENCHFYYNALIGITSRGDNAIMRHNTAYRNGQMGLHSYGMSNGLFEYNHMYENNWWPGGTDKFFVGLAAAGFKTDSTVNSKWQYNLFEDNRAHGLWLDVHSNNATVIYNVGQNNFQHGLFLEYGHTVIAASNWCEGNGNSGIGVTYYEADIWNNTCIDNADHGIYWYRGNRDPLQGDPAFASSFTTEPAPWPCYVAGQTDDQWSSTPCPAGLFHPFQISGCRIYNNIIVGGSSDSTEALIRMKNFKGDTWGLAAVGGLFPLNLNSDYNSYYRRAGRTNAWADMPSDTNTAGMTAIPFTRDTRVFESHGNTTTGYAGTSSDVKALSIASVLAIPSNVQAALGVASVSKRGVIN